MILKYIYSTSLRNAYPKSFVETREQFIFFFNFACSGSIIRFSRHLIIDIHDGKRFIYMAVMHGTRGVVRPFVELEVMFST